MAMTTRPFEVIPALAQIQLGSGSGPPGFWSGRVAYGCALSATFTRLLCKSGLRFFPLHTAPVVRRMVSPTTTALRLFPRGRTNTVKMEDPTRDASGCVT